ncbi:DUF6498-containing protein [Ferrimonas marina]|uniref:Uncharacterized protein n=1 Tax=Ferrimonas marina TaxID=299255 RepID=A0A1M5S0Z5_9GAMM|nr:DUF6498-containing protein [Ferrimonas marina]SHH32081.1 hypothetical protein SAMN02745129_1828 [Ferrimonas marina]
MRPTTDTLAAGQHSQTAAIARNLLINLFAFAVGLGSAYLFDWQITDLVWGLWLCSLVLGYLTILSAIGGGAVAASQLIRSGDFDKKIRTVATIGGIAFGTFLLGFFTVHFFGFHAAHALFLSMFFPLGETTETANDLFGHLPFSSMATFQQLVASYGIFLFAVLIAERKQVFGPLLDALRSVRQNASPTQLNKPDRHSGKRPTRTAAPELELLASQCVGDAMKRPYVNVMRMHMLIFFFAFCHIASVDSFAVYAVVSLVYFFPWSELANIRSAIGANPSTS